MMRHLILVLPDAAAAAIAEQLLLDGVETVQTFSPARFAAGVAAGRAPDADLEAMALGADTLVVAASADQLTARTVAFADRRALRILTVGADPGASRLAALFGLSDPVSLHASPRETALALRTAAPARQPEPTPGPRTVAVWGAAGSPGRSTLAIGLAAELARGGRHVALVDADAHAPSLAMALGLPDEGPGFAMACRQAEAGTLDGAAGGRHAFGGRGGAADVDVLTGLNRPSRWPELSATRVRAALTACAAWAQHTVVDVAAPLERDEEIVSDLLAGPRRNAATLSALESADHVVAVLSADPVGVARFLRGIGELRAVIGPTPLTVVVNRLRRGGVGVDGRGQVRRTLERYADIHDVWFIPEDRRGADAAMLAARPAAEVAARSPMVAAIRRVVGEALLPPAAIELPSRRERRHRSTRRRGPVVAAT